MARYTMTLNKKYVVTTFGLTYVNKLVEVIGIVNYDEAVKLSDILLIALNEKIIDSNYTDYFSDIEFYKCKIVGTEDVVVIWSDIIDSSKTSIVGEKFNYKVTLELSVSAQTISKDAILAELVSKASTYNASLVFTSVTSDQNSVVDILQERLTAAENIVKSLQSLSTVLPMIDSISRGDIEGKLTTIAANISTINDKIETIAAGL